MEFEKWLRTVCFKEPTPEALDLARKAWIEATDMTAKRCKQITQQRYLSEDPAVAIDEKISKEYGV